MANDKNFLEDLDLDLSGDYEGGGDFSLESILAEYKGSAFMDGDRPTPPQELQRRTDEIIREAMGGSDAGRQEDRGADREPERPKDRKPERAPEPDRRSRAGAPEPEDDYDDEDYDEDDDYEDEKPKKPGFFSRLFHRGGRDEDYDDYDDEDEDEDYDDEDYDDEDDYDDRRRGASRRDARRREEPQEEYPQPAYDEKPEIDTSVFDEPEDEKPRDDMESFYDSVRSEKFVTNLDDDSDVREYSGRSSLRDHAAEAEETVEQGEEEEEADSSRRRRGLFGLFSRRDKDGEYDDDEEYDDEDDYDDEEYEDEPEYIDDDDYYDVEPEPDFKKESQRFAARVPSLRFRILGAAIVAIVMAFISHRFISGGSAPFGIGTSAAVCTGVLMIMELAVMALGIDVLIRGFEDMLGFMPGAETLVFISCAASVLDGFNMLLTGRFSNGLPMALISVISLIGAMSARKSYYMALCDSLRASKAASTTYGVTADYESMEGRHILKKVTGTSDGFYHKLVAPDPGERFYDEIAPLLVIVSFVLAFLSTVGKGRAGDFAHSFSLLTAVAAAFPATVLFALPFKFAASILKKSGGAVAGSEGARDIFYTDGALITDLDLFPTGSVTLSGLSIIEGMNGTKVMADTASLIISSDSGLRKVFEELQRSYNLTRRRVDEFACYDGGGIGGIIDGERVLVGTGAFMNLMGIRVPEKLNTVNTFFTAINGELAGAFSLNYIPANSVQSALVSLLGTRTNLLMAVRDFNVTPNTVKQKFKVSMDGVEYLPVDTAYELSQNTLSPGVGVSAVLCRGGLGPFAEVITRGRLLKLITELNTWVTAIGTAIGMAVMFFLCWTGAFAAATVDNIFIFMSVVGLAVYIMSRGVKRRIK